MVTMVNNTALYPYFKAANRIFNVLTTHTHKEMVIMGHDIGGSWPYG